jgi:endogenous inhibitor of DNA gyrase (YacG/DUF329 family)
MKCLICGRKVTPRPENPDHPFCSLRCKTVDLGRWFGEEYVIPAERAEEPTKEQGEDR